MTTRVCAHVAIFFRRQNLSIFSSTNWNDNGKFSDSIQMARIEMSIEATNCPQKLKKATATTSTLM